MDPISTHYYCKDRTNRQTETKVTAYWSQNISTILNINFPVHPPEWPFGCLNVPSTPSEHPHNALTGAPRSHASHLVGSTALHLAGNMTILLDFEARQGHPWRPQQRSTRRCLSSDTEASLAVVEHVADLFEREHPSATRCVELESIGR